MDFFIPIFTGLVVFMNVIEILAACVFIFSLLAMLIKEKKDLASVKMMKFSFIFFISIFLFFILLDFLNTKLDWEIIKAISAASHLIF